jgi:hypothetical protein
MNIEIKISGETTDAKFLAVLSAIVVAQGWEPEIKSEQPTGNIKVSAKAAPKKSVADQVSEALEAAEPEATEETEPTKVETKPEKAKSKYTLEQVRAEAVAISKAGKREEVKALISEHGGEKVTDLDASVYDAFMTSLSTLK